MLDIKFIRENVEVVKKTIENKNAKVDLIEFLNMDSQRRALLAEADALKHQKNVASDEIAKFMKEKKNAKDKIQDKIATALGVTVKEIFNDGEFNKHTRSNR